MKYRKIAVLGLSVAMSVSMLGTTTVFASEPSNSIEIEENETETETTIFTHIREKIHNGDNNVNDSSLIDKSTGDQDTGDVAENGNASASQNVNKGNGINTGVSSTDIIPVDINVDNSHDIIISKDRNVDNSHDRSVATSSSRSSEMGSNSVSAAAERNVKTSSKADTEKAAKTANSDTAKKSSKATDSKTAAKAQDKTKKSSTGDKSNKANEETEEVTTSDNPYVKIFDESIPLSGEVACEHEIAVDIKDGTVFKNGEVVTYCEKCGEILETKETTKETGELPFAGFLGSVAAIIIAIFKHH